MFKTNKQQTGIDATEKMRLNGEGILSLKNDLICESSVVAGTEFGFCNKNYLENRRNPIWSFAVSPSYGLSYYQGTALTTDSGLDSIGIMFGDIMNPNIRFRSDGAGFFGGALNIMNNNSLRLGNTNEIWSIQKNTDLSFGGFRIVKEGADIAFRIDNNFITYTAKQVRLGRIGTDTMDAVTLSQLNSGITNLSNTISDFYIPKNGSVTKLGTMTFADAPIVPNATLASHAVNKGQMDTAIAAFTNFGTLQEIMSQGSTASVSSYINIATSARISIGGALGVAIKNDNTGATFTSENGNASIYGGSLYGVSINGGSGTGYVDIRAKGGVTVNLTNNSGFSVTGDANSFEGIQYTADYSAKFNDRSLVDKAFVLNQFKLLNKDFNVNISGSSGTLTYNDTQYFGYSGTLTLFVDCNQGAKTIVIPNIAIMQGYTVNIIKTDASNNTVTIQGNANINGLSTHILSTRYQKVSIKADQSQYYIF